MRLARALPQGLGRRFRRLVRAFVPAPGGSVAVEAALLLPLLLILMNATYEVAHYALAVNKVDRSAQTLSQLLARAPSIASGDTRNSVPFIAAGAVAQPFDINARGRTVVSVVVDREDDGAVGPFVLWQTTTGKARKTSRVGGGGGAAILPPGLVAPGGSLVVVEVFYDYRPTLWGELLKDMGSGDVEVYRVAYYMPRIAALPGS